MKSQITPPDVLVVSALLLLDEGKLIRRSFANIQPVNVEVPEPTLMSPPIYASPEVSRTPSVVVALPIPKPPETYTSSFIERSYAGLVVPIPTSPVFNIVNSVVVAEGVELATVNRGTFPSERPARLLIVKNDPGVVVPSPKRLIVSFQYKLPDHSSLSII